MGDGDGGRGEDEEKTGSVGHGKKLGVRRRKTRRVQQGTSRRLPNESPDNPRDVFSMEKKRFSFVKIVEFPENLDAEFSLDPVDFSPKWWKNFIREEEEE